MLVRKVAFGLFCCALAACQRADNGPRADRPVTDATAPVTITPIFTGTASCSGRSCHGGLEPRPGQEIAQDEYSKWLSHDPHARAFQVLFEEKSDRIVRNLRGPKKAHEDERCFGCHATPYAAAVRSAAAKQETAFGVGCESCHGAAGNWLGTHTGSHWKALAPDEKRERGMVPTHSIVDVAQTCVGCHVGASPDKDKHLPLPRDVNHDLIAAGHPRLNFELDVFLDNLPPHWNQDAKKKRDGEDMHARTWAHGQLASAGAALDLLAYRADKKNDRPWPEFADYDCFACHHDLLDESWRQKPGYGAGRRRGSLPWGTWYFSTSRLVADDRFQKQVSDLQELLGRTVPPREQVAQQARAASKSIPDLHAHIGKKLNRQIVTDWLRNLGGSDRWKNGASWDAAMQLTLAAYSLNESLGDTALRATIEDLTRTLAFAIQYDSPHRFTPSQIEHVRARLRDIAK